MLMQPILTTYQFELSFYAGQYEVGGNEDGYGAATGGGSGARVESGVADPAQDGGGQGSLGGRGDDRAADAEHGGTGQRVALGHRAAGHARTVAAAVVEESVAVGRGLAEALGLPSPWCGVWEWADRNAEYGSNRFGGSVCGVDGQPWGR